MPDGVQKPGSHPSEKAHGPATELWLAAGIMFHLVACSNQKKALNHGKSASETEQPLRIGAFHAFC
jgi:hypothetical protein